GAGRRRPAARRVTGGREPARRAGPGGDAGPRVPAERGRALEVDAQAGLHDLVVRLDAGRRRRVAAVRVAEVQPDPTGEAHADLARRVDVVVAGVIEHGLEPADVLELHAVLEGMRSPCAQAPARVGAG